MKGKQLFVWDAAEGLPALLKPAGCNSCIRSEADLQFVRPDMMIVGAEQLGKDVEGQGKLLNLADAGTSVLVLRQTQPANLAGYPLVRRAVPAKLAWHADHPLGPATAPVRERPLVRTLGGATSGRRAGPGDRLVAPRGRRATSRRRSMPWSWSRPWARANRLVPGSAWPLGKRPAEPVVPGRCVGLSGVAGRADAAAQPPAATRKSRRTETPRIDFSHETRILF